MPELFYDFYFRGFAFIVIHRDALTFLELGTALNAVDCGATAAILTVTSLSPFVLTVIFSPFLPTLVILPLI